jgi:YegS/Rv2252/BmrU family lipid kinase
MRTHAIVNPAAGKGRVRRLWPDLEPRLRDAAPGLTVEWTTAPTEATRLARAALRDGVERIVAVGGDGTLHEVVNGFFAEDGTALDTSACLVPISCGSGTDFRRALNVPTELDAVRLLESGRDAWVDLLRIEYTTAEGRRAHRYAVNITSFGLSSRVVQAVNRGGGRLPGPIRYFSAILCALVGHRPFPVELTLDGTPLAASEIHLAAVANGHTFGGGVHIAPDAQYDDGELDVVVLHDISALALLRRLPRFYQGTHLDLDGVATARGRRVTARARTDAPIWVEADGEVLGRLPVTVEVVPEALRVQC